MGKWINCKNCGHEYHSSLNRCPECSTATPSFKNIAFIIGAVAVCIVVGTGMFLGFSDNKMEPAPESKPVSAVSDTQSDSSSSKASSSQKTETVTSSKASEKPQSSSSKITSGTESKPKTEIKFPTIGTKEIDGAFYTTLPYYYLRYSHELYSGFITDVSFEEFAYTLTEENRQDGFTEIYKNSDGSATLKMDSNTNRSAYIADYITSLIEALSELKGQEFVTSAEHGAFKNLTVNVNKNELANIEKSLIVITGTAFFEYQLFSLSDNTSTVTINYPNGNQEIINFPEDIVDY